MANNLPTEKKVLAVSMLAEGSSIRSIERITRVHRDTIMHLARIFHKGVEQKGGRSVRKLENTELYDDTLYRPEPDRL